MTLPHQMVKTTDENQVVAGYAANADEITTHVALIQDVMSRVMIRDTHYGVIPGTDKPTLLKPGAEVLCTTFRIAPTFEMEDLSTEDMIRYRVVCRGVHQNTSILLGDGVGECSSMEEKYKWRGANDRQFENTPDNRRRVKYGYNNRETKQVRTEPFDLANTVLKMAAKRAQVAMTLNVLAASDMFTQDMEDAERDEAQPVRQAPQSSGGGNVATEPQVKLLNVKLQQANLDSAQLCDAFGVGTIPELPFDKVNEALAWISEHAEG